MATAPEVEDREAVDRHPSCQALASDSATLIDVLVRQARDQTDKSVYIFLHDGETESARLSFGELEAQVRELARLFLDRLGPCPPRKQPREEEREQEREQERVLLVYPPGLDFAVAFLACLRAGLVAVPALPPASRRHLPRLRGIVRDARPQLVASCGSALDRLQGSDLPELHALDLLDTGQRSSTAVDLELPPPPHPEQLAFLQYTSGSTSTPKGVCISHANLLANEETIHRTLGTHRGSTVVGWLPPHHDMGLIGTLLQPIYLGATCVLMSPGAFLQQPVRWLQAISRYRADTSGGPNFAYDLCVRRISPEQRAHLDLSCWTLAFNGAEPVRAETLERFAATFADCGFDRRALYPCYGLAEATLLVAGGRRSEAPVIATFEAAELEQDRARELAPSDDEQADLATTRRLVSSGRAAYGVEVVIVDPQSHRRLPAGTVGEIWIRGDGVAQGYWQGEATEAATLDDTFEARLVDPSSSPGTYLRSGDLGFLRSDGELFVTGRRKDLIILRGRNHYPQDLELTVADAHAALLPAAGVAVSDEIDDREQLVVLHELDRHYRDQPTPVFDAVQQALAAAHQVRAHEIVLLRQGSLPRTSSGKVRRRATLVEYRAGRLPVVAHTVARETVQTRSQPSAPSPEIPTARAAPGMERAAWDDLDRGTLLEHEDPSRALDAFLRQLLERRLGTGLEDRSLTALGLDSLLAVELRVDIEQRFDVDIPESRWLDGLTFGELRQTILDSLDRQPDSKLGTSLSQVTTARSLNDRASQSYPATAGQQAIYYLDRLAPAAYHVYGAARVLQPLDVEKVQLALDALLTRHAALRSRFVEEDGAELQVRIAGGPDSKVRVETQSTAEATDLGSVLEAKIRRPFDLAAGPPMRLCLHHDADGRQILLLVLHHLVADFASLGMVLRDLAQLYAGNSSPSPDATYSDFARLQRLRSTVPDGERAAAYWQRQLGDVEAPFLDLPLDRPRPPVQTFAGGEVHRRLDADLTLALRQLAREQGTTLFSVLLASYQALLHRWSGQDDVCVGTPASLRDRAEFETLVGYLVNPIVLRSRQRQKNLAFDAFLQQGWQTVLDGLAHRHFPFAHLVELLQPPRDRSRSPLFQAFFVWQQDRRTDPAGLAALALGAAEIPVHLGPLDLEAHALDPVAAQFDLSLRMAELPASLATPSSLAVRNAGLYVSLEYNRDLFDIGTAERWLDQFEHFLRAVANSATLPLDEIPLLSPDQQAQLYLTSAPLDPGSTTELFPAQLSHHAEHTPDAIAIWLQGTEGPRQITYRQLAQAVERLARRLRSAGVGPEVTVGVCAGRTPEMLVALLAILKAGGAYVPLDPAYPLPRLRFLLEDSGAQVVIVDGSASPELRRGTTQSVTLIELEALSCSESSEETHAFVAPEPLYPEPLDPEPLHPESGAYVLYTSGSTGQPKGVVVSRASLAAFLNWAAASYQREELSAVLASTSISFDPSIFELFLPLYLGTTVVLVRDLSELGGLPSQAAVSLINTVPSALAAALEGGVDVLPATLRTINLCGEALPRELAERLLETAGVPRLVNAYGPTEDTIYSLTGEAEAGAAMPPPIGRPVIGSHAVIADRRGRPVAPGVRGELLLGGDQLARGYLGRPALTAERFIPDAVPDAVPDAESGRVGGRLYRSGDLVRLRPDGEVGYLGRLDHQIKLRGIRIELGEIEATLEALPEVTAAAVVARDEQLVAFTATQLEPVELRRVLSARLPAHLVPGQIVTLDALPLLSNGKLDRRALLELPLEGAAPSRGRAPFVAPETEVELLLAEIWHDITGQAEIGIHDDFFELGGHSLQAMSMLARLRETFGVDLDLRSMLEARTLYGLAQAIATALLSELDDAEVQELLAEEGVG